MPNIFCPPLSIHFLIDAKYERLSELQAYLYKLLCRDPEDPTFDGLDIPVYFHIGESGQPIPLITAIPSLCHVIVPIIDSKMYLDNYWKNCMEQTLNWVKNNKTSTRFIPIQECKDAFDICDGIKDFQFITLNNDENGILPILETRLKFQIRLFTDLVSFLSNTGRLTLFLSHSKRDKDKTGLIRAQEFKDYLTHETKLNKFFDTNDIRDGKNFKEEINENLKNSIFVLISSATYSSREWCRKEVLQSKFNALPIVRVDVTEGVCDRIFPYMANTPAIRFNGDWEEVLALILRTALDHQYQSHYLRILSEYVESDRKVGVEPTVPELLGIHYHHESSSVVLYPEPPLGEEELDVLRHSFKDKLFITPMQFFTSNLYLNRKKIAVSISEPEGYKNGPTCLEMFNDAAIEIARHLLAANAVLVYGGDLRENNGFTRSLGDIAYQYASGKGTDSSVKYLYNFFAWPICNNVTDAERIFFKKNRIEPIYCPMPESCNPALKDKSINEIYSGNPRMFAESLSLMRTQRMAFSDAAVIIGGRTKGFKGYAPGIIEEAYRFVNKGIPIYIVGAFGGASELLHELIVGEKTVADIESSVAMEHALREQLDYFGEISPLQTYLSEFDNRGYSMLNNGLTDEENAILRTSTSVIEIVALILKGLSNLN